MDKRALKTFADVERAMAPYMSVGAKKDTTVERMQPLMERLGHPEKKLRIIHIAGTSGKTSTAYYIADLLKATGKRVGLTVSPHVQTINERVQINLELLPEAEFCSLIEQFLELVGDINPQPTYFELLAAFAYWHFAKSELDYAVIETGVGGLHDASNIANSPEKICVITDIGLDHTQLLGESIAEIAAQKAGIIYAGNQVFMYQQSDEVMDVFQKKMKEVRATLNTLSINDNNLELVEASNGLPLFQQRNWQLARSVVEYIASKDHLHIPANYDPASVWIPGRMQILKLRDKTVVLDGAHNAQKMEAFVTSFQKKYGSIKVPVLIALKNGKEYKTVLPLLKPICSALVVTIFEVPASAPLSPVDPEMLAEAARKIGIRNVRVVSEPTSAYEQLITEASDVAVVTGSFYLLGNILDQKPNLPPAL
jgi:dihydrofolate synthase / folylpolyglutamate synthase